MHNVQLMETNRKKWKYKRANTFK